MTLEQCIQYDKAMYIKNGWIAHNKLLKERAKNLRLDDSLIKDWNDHRTFMYEVYKTKKSPLWRMLIP